MSGLLQFGEINLTYNPQYREQYGVTATPTLIYFPRDKLNSKPVRYRGQKVLHMMREWLNQQLEKN